jgi:hypothetical protein
VNKEENLSNINFLAGNKQEEPSESINENKEHLFEEQTPSPNVRPWVRYFARYIDSFTFSFLLRFLQEVNSIYFFPNSALESGLSIFFLWIFIDFLWILIESSFLSSWGTTFGKWLLGIKVRNHEGGKLTYFTALKRSTLVWFKGLGMGLPIVTLFTLISAYITLTEKGITTWDQDCHLIVTHQKIGIIRSIVATLLIILFISIEIIEIYFEWKS